MTAGVPHAARLSVLARLQLGLEALYRVETRLPIDAFVVDAETRDAALGEGARTPREQLVVRQSGGELAMALFIFCLLTHLDLTQVIKAYRYSH